jgi:23S rRNA (guanine2445-N2)-methyltransferase / 23S rRNA (guanine2069-N7)-methyltransferase
MSLDLIAVTAFGLESLAVRELADLGYAAKPSSTGRIPFSADPIAVARCNLMLRTVGRLLLKVGSFPAPDFGVLFDATYALPWQEWIPRDGAFPVNGRSVKSQLSSVPACQRVVKKAIAQKLMDAHGVSTLPETGPRFIAEVSLLQDVATLTLDTSGDGLNKRGYRPVVGPAALKETLAAGLVMLSGWKPHQPLVDPFCGTGTIAIEAALMARGIAPGINRDFDSVHWPALPGDIWDAAEEEAHSLATGALGHTIHASDIDDRSLALARQNAAAAGVERDIHFVRRDVRDLSSTRDYGVIIANPPYGERLSDPEEVELLYRALPLVFRKLPTWSFHILTARLDLEQIFGQPATRRRKLFNAQIECTYFSFLGPKPPRDPAERALSASEGPSPVAGAQPDPAELALTDAEAITQADTDVAAAAPTALAPEPAVEPAPEPRRERTPPAPRPPAFGGLSDRDRKDIADFAARLSSRQRHLRRWPKRGITCYRLYERDVPDVPVIVDRYEDYLHIVEYERPSQRTAAQQDEFLDGVADAAASALELPRAHVFVKSRPRQRDFGQHEKVTEERTIIVAHEGGLSFEVNLSSYTDVGLFLDHRQTRAMVRDEGRGKRFLNLFCYTGSFTVYACAGGAASTTSVDLSNTYLDWTARNLGINRFTPTSPCPNRLVRSGVMEFLTEHPHGAHYDLVVADPPTYSRSKSTEDDWDVQRDHGAMLTGIATVLSPGGVIYFSTNFRKFKLEEESLPRELTVREITNKTVPEDYRNERIHRCWRMVKTP